MTMYILEVVAKETRFTYEKSCFLFSVIGFYDQSCG